MKYELSVIYLTYNGASILHKTLSLLLLGVNNAPINGQIVVVDNGSTDNTQILLELYREHKNVKVVTLPENLGFSGGNLKGFEAAEGDLVAFVSNDAYFSAYYPWEHFKDYNGNILWGGDIVDWDGYWNKVNGEVYPYCGGWFVCANRDVWSKIMWDENFYPYDCEDVDLSIQAAKNGIKLLKAPVGAKHASGYTIGRDRSRIDQTNKMKKYLDTKWSEQWNKP